MGNVPVSKERFISLLKQNRKLSGRYFRTIVGILSRPALRLGFSLLITPLTSSVLVGKKKNPLLVDWLGR